jgi:hypothetical protein
MARRRGHAGIQTLATVEIGLDRKKDRLWVRRKHFPLAYSM